MELHITIDNYFHFSFEIEICEYTKVKEREIVLDNT